VLETLDYEGISSSPKRPKMIQKLFIVHEFNKLN